MAIAALNKQALGHTLANYWLLLLSIDLGTFYDVSNTTGFHLSLFGGLTSSCVFPRHYRGYPPPPTNHPYANTCGIEKLSKIVGNSVSYSLQSS